MSSIDMPTMPNLQPLTDQIDTRRLVLSLTGHLNRQWRRLVDRRLQPLGLTEATWLPLLYISRAKAPLRQKDLAALIGLDSSSVVRLLDGLETAGYVQRLEGTDRREKLIHLTPAGQKTVATVEMVVQEGRKRLFRDVNRDELGAACSVLQQLLGTMESLGENLWSEEGHHD